MEFRNKSRVTLALAILSTFSFSLRMSANTVIPASGKVHGQYLGLSYPGTSSFVAQLAAHRKEIPFRPVFRNNLISGSDFSALKRLMSPAPSAGGRSSGLNTKNSLSNTSSSSFPFFGAGLNETQTGGWEPSDCSLAVGPNYAVEPSNSAVAIYQKSSNWRGTNPTLSQLSITDANTFMNWPVVQGTDPFGNTNYSTAFDCRAIYDTRGKRFIVTYDAFPYYDENAVYHSPMLFAVSQSSNANGAWYTFQVDLAPYIVVDPANNPGPLWDFPSLGMDESNIYVTANVFGDSYFQGASLIAIDRASLESGNLGGTIWGGLNATLTPPIVHSAGTNGSSYFAVSQPYSDTIGMYAVTGGTTPVLSSPNNISAPFYIFPGFAAEPGGGFLDTLDSRFQDKVVQIVDRVFAVHCVDVNGYPTVRAYELDGNLQTMTQMMDCYMSSTSNDFNPSITANDQGSVAINWDYCDTGTRVKPGTVYESIAVLTLSGKKSWPAVSKGKAVPGSGSSVTRYSYRNGDYSMMMIDPSNPMIAWGINMNTFDSFDWQNYIFAVNLKK